MIGQFTTLREEQERQLEGRLKCMNTELIEINEKISNLTFQRDRLELHMRHVARELHRLRATEVKTVLMEVRE